MSTARDQGMPSELTGTLVSSANAPVKPTPMHRTKTDAALADAERAHMDDPERAEVLARARRFKASWIELAEALSSVKRSGRWKQWGYESFEAYAQGELRIRQATAEKLVLVPTIAGTFTEFYGSAPGFEPTHWWWQAGVTVSWNFDLTNVGNIQSSNAVATGAAAAEDKARLLAGDAIHRYWQTVVAGIAQSRSARAGRDAAVHASEQARVQYLAGSATQLDLLQARRDAFQAEVTRIQDDANLLNARAQLRLASGRSLLR